MDDHAICGYQQCGFISAVQYPHARVYRTCRRGNSSDLLNTTQGHLQASCSSPTHTYTSHLRTSFCSRACGSECVYGAVITATCLSSISMSKMASHPMLMWKVSPRTLPMMHDRLLNGNLSAGTRGRGAICLLPSSLVRCWLRSPFQHPHASSEPPRVVDFV